MSHTERLGQRIRETRIRAGITQAETAQATGVHPSTLLGWEQGHHAPKLERMAKLAAALGVPVASLLVDESAGAACVAEVWVSRRTLQDVRKGGRGAALEAAERLARALEPLIWQAASGRLPRAQDTPARAKPRRTRAEVLAGVRQASEMAQAAKLRRLSSELDAIQAAPITDDERDA